MMNILLINDNPVISRLFVLCTRDESMVLEEISSVGELDAKVYDVVFVDESSYARDVAVSVEKYKEAKKIFISYRSDEMRGFDVTIKKPFLPSEVIDILEIVEKSIADKVMQVQPFDTNELEDIISVNEEIPSSSVLDEQELEKIKSLLDMEDEPEEISIYSEDEMQTRKIEVIKEQLIAEGLEIVEEEEIVEELSIGFDGTMKPYKKDKTAKKSKKEKKKSKNKKRIKKAVLQTFKNLTKKQRKTLRKGKEVTVTIQLKDKKQ